MKKHIAKHSIIFWNLTVHSCMVNMICKVPGTCNQSTVRFVVILIGMLTQHHCGNELSLIINSGLFPLLRYILKETGNLIVILYFLYIVDLVRTTLTSFHDALISN